MDFRPSPKPNRQRLKKFDSYVERSNTARRTAEVNKPISTLERSSSNNFRKLVNHPEKRGLVNTKVNLSHGTHGNTQPAKKSSTNLALSAVLNSKSFSGITKEKTIYVNQIKRKSLGSKLFFSFGSLVLIVAAALSIQSFLINRQAKDQVDVLAASNSADEQGVEQGTGSEPAESKPDSKAYKAYQVAGDKPRYIRIPSQSISARIKELGLKNDGEVDAPWNIHDAGWFNGSIKPGSKNGVSLIMGHVSGRKMPGIFKNIDKLVPGDSIEVEKGSGEVLVYTVDKVEEYDIETIDMAKILYEVEKGKQSLRLMTCSGSYDSSTQEFLSRTVVYASPKI